MSESFVFNLDPVLLRIGSIQIRYYGLIFATMICIGFIIWRHQMVAAGHTKEMAERFFIWGVIAVVAGARLGQCLFYEPSRYLADPLSVLYVWKGGLSSHGATLGLLIALTLFALLNRLRIIEVLDCFSIPAALGVTMVRLGNFFNSEIVGRATDLPWAVKFVRYDGGKVARHPSQLYESALGIFLIWLLYFISRRAGKGKCPPGLMSGLFLTVYFFGRFMIEFEKEYLVLKDSFFTMGQYLSIPPFLLGVGVLAWSWLIARGK